MYPSASTVKVAFLDRFSPQLAHTYIYKNPQNKNEFVRVNIGSPLPLFCPQNPDFRPRNPENPCKYEVICLKSTRIAEISASLGKSGSKNTMATSDFRPEVEIRPFRACAMKNMQYNLYLWPNRRNFSVLKEIGVEEHDADVRFKSGSGNMAVSCMRNASGHNYRNTSVIVDMWADNTLQGRISSQ